MRMIAHEYTTAIDAQERGILCLQNIQDFTISHAL
jgi:hypothetical protein